MWYGFLAQVVMQNPFGTRPAPDIILVIFWLIFGIGFPFILFSTKLVIKLYDDGIHIQLFPFHLSFRKITFEEIEFYEIKTYNPIKEYGGWGIRKGRQRIAYNMSGNKGVQVKLKKGKRILIGSQQAEKLYQAIHAQLNQ